jgi:hypothetical protein
MMLPPEADFAWLPDALTMKSARGLIADGQMQQVGRGLKEHMSDLDGAQDLLNSTGRQPHSP